MGNNYPCYQRLHSAEVVYLVYRGIGFGEHPVLVGIFKTESVAREEFERQLVFVEDFHGKHWDVVWEHPILPGTSFMIDKASTRYGDVVYIIAEVLRG